MSILAVMVLMFVILLYGSVLSLLCRRLRVGEFRGLSVLLDRSVWYRGGCCGGGGGLGLEYRRIY